MDWQLRGCEIRNLLYFPGRGRGTQQLLGLSRTTERQNSSLCREGAGGNSPPATRRSFWPPSRTSNLRLGAGGSLRRCPQWGSKGGGLGIATISLLKDFFKLNIYVHLHSSFMYLTTKLKMPKASIFKMSVLDTLARCMRDAEPVVAVWYPVRVSGMASVIRSLSFRLIGGGRKGKSAILYFLFFN